LHIVAIDGLSGEKLARATELSAALGATTFEAQARLRSPGSGPFIVNIFAAKGQAEELASGLVARGFTTATLSSAEIEAEANQLIVRRFELEDQALRVETTSGEALTVSYREVELLLRGTGITSSTSMETRKERKLDLGAAVISGGLKMMKTTTTKREVTSEEREAFFNLYVGMGPTLAFYENGLVYDGLGPSRALSRSANFLQLLAELRKRCPGARYDDRLQNKAGAVALLGPRLNPEEHLVIATALLAKTLRKSRSA